jgi:hypothetical protein
MVHQQCQMKSASPPTSMREIARRPSSGRAVLAAVPPDAAIGTVHNPSTPLNVWQTTDHTATWAGRCHEAPASARSLPRPLSTTATTSWRLTLELEPLLLQLSLCHYAGPPFVRCPPTCGMRTISSTHTTMTSCLTHAPALTQSVYPSPPPPTSLLGARRELELVALVGR